MAAPIQRMWLALDEYMREIKETETSDAAKHKARGYAECMVHILPQPGWPDADTIIRHSLNRYNAYKAGEVMPSTPGFPPKDADSDLGFAYGVDYLKVEKDIAEVGERASKPTKKTKFDDVLTAAIRKALDNGFEPAMLAATYNSTVAEIEAMRV